jgi:hypothetical protein
MKKIVSLLMLAATIFGISSCQAQKAKWKEMDAFHEVMAQTFHPAEEGKLGPIKTRSQEMLDKALAWQKSTAPEGYDKKAVEGSLKNLVTGSKELHELIKTNPADNTLKEKLSGLHDIFHEIMEKCEKEDHHM